VAAPERFPPEQAKPPSPLILPAASKRADGTPRFDLVLDPALAASDHGLRYLIQQETRYDGFERATRDVIDAHLLPGDLFIDVGAHVGAMSLTAATAPAGDVQVLAIEPAPDNLRQLEASVAANGLASRVTVVPAAIGAASGEARLHLIRGSMGHRLADDTVLGGTVDVALISLDELLARFPQHDQRRVVLKIDVEGHEPEVLAGAAKLLASGRLRLLIWEKAGPMTTGLQAMTETIARHRLTSFMFPLHDWGGPLIPFVPSPALGNVFCFAPGERRRPSYFRDPARRSPYNAAFGMPPAQEQLLSFAEALARAGGSDGSRWSNWEALGPGSLERAEAAATHIPPGARVLDLGAGRMELSRRLPLGAQYQPVDLVAWSSDCIAIDLNATPLPEGRFEVIAALGLLEYIHRPAALLAAARSIGFRLLATYPPLESGLPVAARRGYGWMNDIDLATFEAMLAAGGWRIVQRRPVADALFWVCEAGPA
jgi:FkbM family methyltransferase